MVTLAFYFRTLGVFASFGCTYIFGSLLSCSSIYVLAQKSRPLGSNHLIYKSHLRDNQVKILCATGPIGCGKTRIAYEEAINRLKTNHVRKIVLAIPNSKNKDVDNIKRFDDWVRKIMDDFEDHLTKKELDSFLRRNKVEFTTLESISGRVFRNAFVIADEMQDSSVSEVQMLTSFVGYNSKLVISAITTSDSEAKPNESKINGVLDFVKRYKAYMDGKNITTANGKNSHNGIVAHHFNTTDDIVEDAPLSRVVDIVNEIYNYVPNVAEHDTKTISLDEEKKKAVIQRAAKETMFEKSDAAMIPRGWMKERDFW